MKVVKVSNSASRIKEIMEIFDISQNEFCKRTGLDASTVSLYINGKREPRQDKLYSISKVFDVDPAWLMGLDVPMRNHKMQMIKEDFLAKTGNMELLIELASKPELSDALKHYLALSFEHQQLALNLLNSLPTVDNKPKDK